MESLLGNRSALSQESTAWQKILIYGTVKFWTTPEEALRGCEGPYQGGHTLHLGAAFLCRMPQVGDSPVLHPTCLTLQNPTFTGSNLGLPAKQELKKKKIKSCFKLQWSQLSKFPKNLVTFLFLQQILILGMFQCADGHTRLGWLRRTGLLRCALSHQEPGSFSNQKQQFHRLGRAREILELPELGTFSCCVSSKMY